MEVILSQDVDKIGKAGVVVKVKDGFARNFLIPNRLAVPLTPANLKKLEEGNKAQKQQLEKLKREAEGLGGRLSGLSLTISALSKDNEELYGSVSAQDIAGSLKEEGFEIDKEAILLAEPIKALGIYEVNIKLHPEVQAKVKVWIVKK